MPALIEPGVVPALSLVRDETREVPAEIEALRAAVADVTGVAIP